MVLIDEFKYPHAIFELGKGELSSEGLLYGYKRMFDFLGLGDKQHLGLTIIVTPKWMFMAPINKPYHSES